MKKKIFSTVLALVVTVAGLMTTSFDSYAATQTTGWNVEYNGQGFSSDYNVDKSTITSVMPGDTVVFQVNYKNNSSATTDFYLSTDVIASLEEKNADGSSANISGGAYSYKISYILNGNTNVLYDSETVGGDNTTVVGLQQVQGGLKNGENAFMSVGSLASQASGTVVIEIKLDGNSQDNDYMQKLAQLDVRFGAEKQTSPENVVVNTSETKRVVYTIPGGTQVVVLEEPAVPLANTNTLGSPQTGDSIIPIIVCSMMLLIGLLLVISYFWISKNNREKVA